MNFIKRKYYIIKKIIENEGKDYNNKNYGSYLVGPVANLFASKGETTEVIKFEVSMKREENKIGIFETIREGLKRVVDKENLQHQIGMGGVVLLEEGKASIHVMGDYKKTDMVENTPEVDDDWFKYFPMGPKLTCFSCILSGDPTGGDYMNLRPDHTHVFSRDLKHGGHYHYELTKDVKFVGYLNFAKSVYRVNNAYLESYVE